KYTPNDGYTGADEFEYNLIACFPIPKSPVRTGLQNCLTSTAPVKITVDPAPETTTTVAPTTTVTVAPADVTTSTVAAAPAPPAAPAATLPRTGSTSGPLAVLGGFAVLVGAGLLALVRRRRAVA